MPLDKEQRMKVEEAIMDAQIACEKYLETATAVQFKLFEVAILSTLETLDGVREFMLDDSKRDNYKLHALVPLQTYYMQKAINDAPPSTPRKKKATT